MRNVKEAPCLNLISWNMKHSRKSWQYLMSLNPMPDVALLQEALKPNVGFYWITPALEDNWHIEGHLKPKYCSAIVGLSDRVQGRPIPTKRIGDPEKQSIPVSRLGTIAVAEIDLPSRESIFIASVYSYWENTFSDKRPIFADASAHRIISDISALIGSRKGAHILVAGDWNIFHGYGDDGSEYWKARYDTVFSRMSAIGFHFAGPHQRAETRHERKPKYFPIDDKNVPTYRRGGPGKPDSARDQLDFVFVTRGLSDRIHVKALDNPDEWGPSDHCRIAIDIFANRT